jgi:hypothetical protein
MSGAFLERFMLGLIIPNISFDMNPLFTGGPRGLRLSVPTAIITRAYVPITNVYFFADNRVGAVK